MGFDFSQQKMVEHGIDVVKAALVRYDEIYGDMLVPYEFIVPNNSASWPESLWALRLGPLVSHIRNRLDYFEYKDELEALGFDYRPQRRGRRPRS
jgi:hypothetical protein